jgi:preprotein translocase subunit SecD
LVGFLAVVTLSVLWAAATSQIRLGLDLQGGIAVVLTAPPGTPPEVVDKAIDIIRNRVDALGVAEPDITRQGGQNIQVQLPGVKDPDSAIRIIGTTAQLQFRPVLDLLGPPGTPEQPVTPTATPVTPTVSTTSTITPSASATDSATSSSGRPSAAVTPTANPVSTTPTASSVAPTPTAAASATPTVPSAATETVSGVTTPDQDVTTSIVVLTDTQNIRYRLGPARVVGSEVTGATADRQTQQIQGGAVLAGDWQVTLKFSSAGDQKYKKLTGELACLPMDRPQRQIAIVLDHVVQSAPQVAQSVQCNQGISGGGIITVGSGAKDPKKEAQDLATVLKFGALPAPFQRSNIQEVSATLGRDSLRAGLIAGIFGLVLVATYAVLYYRALGLVIVAGLGVFGALLYAVVAALSELRGLSLSLAGIAGVIVSIGITSDSYIVYFERIKEEVRQGRTVRSSVEKGFSRAYRTIFTADLVSFSAAAVLYVVAVSSVKGFALLLGIATILDMIVTFFFTRNVVRVLLPTRWFSEGRFIGVSHTSLGAEAIA